MRRVHLGRRSLCVLAAVVAVGGCELIAAIDREKIVPTDTSNERGALGGYQNGFVFGWAIGDPPDVPVQVRIEVDGAVVTTVTADQPRPDLVQQGLHTTGNAGFRTDIGPLAAGSEIRAFIDASNFELMNSPLIVEGGGAGGSGGMPATGGNGGMPTTGGSGGMPATGGSAGMAGAGGTGGTGGS